MSPNKRSLEWKIARVKEYLSGQGSYRGKTRRFYEFRLLLLISIEQGR